TRPRTSSPTRSSSDLTRRVGRTMFLCVAGFALSTIVFGLSTFFDLSLAALVVLGACDMVSVFVRQTLVQIATPDEMRGRVSAVNSVFIDRKSTRLNSSHVAISYAVFCLKKKKY